MSALTKKRTIDTLISVIIDDADSQDEDLAIEIDCNEPCRYFQQCKNIPGDWACAHKDSMLDQCQNKEVRKEVIRKIIKSLKEELKAMNEEQQ